MSTVATSFGDVPLETLVKRYESEKQREARKYEKRLAFLQTDAGKEWNRAKAKAYYEKHKTEVLAKRKDWYMINRKSKKDSPGSSELPAAEN